MAKTPNQSDLLTTHISEGDVGAALNLLLETLTEEEKRTRRDCAQAMEKGEYKTAKSVLAFVDRLLAFTEKVKVLTQEWNKLEKIQDNATPEVQQIVSKRFFGRKSEGKVTPQSAFERPILEALDDMGGGGITKAVLDRVEKKMASVLRPLDYKPLKSRDTEMRWRIMARFARNDMVNKDGRMKKSSRNGYWEISEKGRNWLKKKTAAVASTQTSLDLFPSKLLVSAKKGNAKA
ncbi:MAG: winged helix-turn-helix domain-containing protein [Kiritimatiellae bacterium]|nr:winged helix-turn-helix domain-containing protein [Kiritimatiellia bacterium]